MFLSSLRLLSRPQPVRMQGVTRRAVSYSRFLACKEPAEGSADGEQPANDASETVVEEGQSSTAPDESEVAALRSEAEEMRSKYMQSLAEMENVRSIARRDVETARTFAIQSFAKNLLDVADNLARATGSVTQEDVKENEGTPLGNLYDGVVLTDQQLHKVFEANGVTKVRQIK